MVRLPQIVSATVLAAVFIPMLLWAVISTVAAVFAAPTPIGRSMLYAFGFVFLTILFFAILCTELGIIDTSTGVEVQNLWVCLYFSAATLTTLGYGDFAPMPEARVIAAVEAFSGLVIMGLITAVAFFLITQHSSKLRMGGAGRSGPADPSG